MRAVLQVFSFDLVSRFLGALVVPMLIRFMNPREYAWYTFAFALANAVSGAFSSSFNRVYIVGENRIFRGDVRSALALLQALLIAAFTALMFSLASWGKLSVVAISLLVLGICLSDFVKTIFQRDQKFLRFSMVELIRSIIAASAIAVLLIWAGTLIQAWQVLGVQAIALLVVAAAFLCQNFDLEFRHLWIQIKQLVGGLARSSYGLLFGYFCVLAPLSQMDVIMLKWQGTEHMLASYGSAFGYYSLLLMALNSLHVVLLPLIQSAQDKDSLKRVFKRQKLLTAAILPGVLAAIIAAQWFIPWIDKGKYPEAVVIFRVLACSAVVSLACSPFIHILIKFEDFRFLLWFVSGLFLGSSGLYYLAVRWAGGIGASWACLTTFCILNAAVWLRARFKFGI